MTSLIVALLMLMNSERAEPLILDPVLSERAQERADYLCETGQWSHDGWTKSFHDYHDYWIGENLHRIRPTTDPVKFPPRADKIHKLNMGSPAHAWNVTNLKYTHVGIATSSCHVTVQLFLGKKR